MLKTSISNLSENGENVAYLAWKFIRAMERSGGFQKKGSTNKLSGEMIAAINVTSLVISLRTTPYRRWSTNHMWSLEEINERRRNGSLTSSKGKL